MQYQKGLKKPYFHVTENTSDIAFLIGSNVLSWPAHCAHYIFPPFEQNIVF